MTDIEKTHVKKELYRQKPKAQFECFRHGHLYYTAHLEDREVRFEVPASDTGDAPWLPEMEAQLLVRYIFA